MKMIRRMEVTVETDEITIIRGRREEESTVCPECGASMMPAGSDRSYDLIFPNRSTIGGDFRSATNLSIGNASSVSVTTSPRAAADSSDLPIPEPSGYSVIQRKS